MEIMNNFNKKTSFPSSPIFFYEGTSWQSPKKRDKLTTTATMVKRKKGGIGAIGAPFALFLHPSKVIQTKWPNDWKVWKCSSALIVGKGMHNVSHKMQLCYKVHLSKFDDGTIFHIVVCNFSFITKDPTPFDDELTMGATAPPIGTCSSAPIFGRGANFSTASGCGKGPMSQTCMQMELRWMMNIQPLRMLWSTPQRLGKKLESGFVRPFALAGP